MALSAEKVSPSGSAVRNMGWYVTFAGMGINLMLGVLYTWSVITKNLPSTKDLPNLPADVANAWKWDDAGKSWPYSIALLVFAFSTVIAGRLQDTVGPRRVATIGGVLVGAGLILASFFSSPIGFAIGFGLLGGAGIGFGYASATPPAIKWFTKSMTGMISGLVVAGFGLASVWAAPVAELLIKHFNKEPLFGSLYGPQACVFILGIVFVVVVVTLAQILKPPPAGYVPPERSGPAKKTSVPASAGSYELGAGQMLRTPQFYVAWVVYAIAAGAGLMVVGKLAGFVDLKEGLNLQLGFLAVAVLAIGNGGGRVIAGILSDRIGRKGALALFMIIQLVMMVILGITTTTFIGGAVLVCIVAAIIGACYGSNLAVFPAITKDWYGLKNFGLNYGFIFTAWGIGGFGMSQMIGFIGDANKGSENPYRLAFFIAAGLLALALVLLAVFFRSPHKDEHPAP